MILFSYGPYFILHITSPIFPSHFNLQDHLYQ